MRRTFRLALMAGVAAAAGSAKAAPVLTAAGVADGFTISTFAVTDPGDTGFGPFGLAAANGQVLVSSYNSGTRYLFNDADGQTAGTALHTYTSNSSTQGYTAAGGKFYGTQNSQFVQFAADGSVDHVLTGVTASPYLGMVGTPDGHVIASSNSGLIKIDPNAAGGAGSFTVLAAGVFPDGVSITKDGKTLVVEVSGVIETLNALTGALIATYGTSGSPDGTGVIVGGALDGDIVVNTNAGNVDLIDPAHNAYTTIATGGTRGDYTAADPNGTLLLDESQGVFRLALAGGSIGGGGGPTVPEPASLALLAAGLAGLGAARRRA